MPIDLGNGVLVTIPAPTSVPVAVVAPGPQGPQGIPGGDAQIHTQTTPSAQWSISWTRRATPPSVSVFVGGRQIIADVDASAISTILVTFPTATAGYAVLI